MDDDSSDWEPDYSIEGLHIHERAVLYALCLIQIEEGISWVPMRRVYQEYEEIIRKFPLDESISEVLDQSGQDPKSQREIINHISNLEMSGFIQVKKVGPVEQISATQDARNLRDSIEHIDEIE